MQKRRLHVFVQSKTLSRVGACARLAATAEASQPGDKVKAMYDFCNYRLKKYVSSKNVYANKCLRFGAAEKAQ